MRRGRVKVSAAPFCLSAYRCAQMRILSAEVFFLERRREGLAAMRLLPAALIVTALIVWILWSLIFEKQPDAPFEQSVLVCAEGEEYAHG